MKNKKVKLTLIIIACAVALIGGYKLLDTCCYPFVEAKAHFYLCKKYDAKSDDIMLIDYNQSHIYWEDYYVFLSKPVWIDFSFKYDYNGRSFVVCREDGKFYDDYQLDELEQWCTEWLQENVDERIIGLQIESADILWYQIYTGKKSNYILDRTDTYDFLNCYSFNELAEHCRIIYCYKGLGDELDESEKSKIISKLNDKLKLNSDIVISNSTSYLEKNFLSNYTNTFIPQ